MQTLLEKFRRKAVFLDRDGTIVYDSGYLCKAASVRFRPGAITSLHRLKERGYAIVLVSNQSGVGRGLVSKLQADQVHARIVQKLLEAGVEFDGVYYCFHAPAAHCRCRKPAPELLHRAAQELKLELRRSFMVGDKFSDIEAGRRAGCTTILLSGTHGLGGMQQQPDYRGSSWRAVERIIFDQE
jgi:D-glycero-D-manno-heptose 1,7-bisphosphate phosphatase